MTIGKLAEIVAAHEAQLEQLRRELAELRAREAEFILRMNATTATLKRRRGP